MAIQNITQRRNALIQSVGKKGLQALFPNDFEVYFSALELVDSEDNIVQYFAFPINPNNITENENAITNVKKTNAGITTINTSTFVPIQINISGNFGRRIKLVTRYDEGSLPFFAGVNYSEEFTAKIGFAELSSFIKSGYGCIKVLDRIVKQSRQLDRNNNPHTLYFYNLSLGNAYIINADSLNLNQNMQSNMIWDYNLSMTAIAPLNQTRNTSLLGVGGVIGSEIAKQSLTTVRNVSSVLRSLPVSIG